MEILRKIKTFFSKKKIFFFSFLFLFLLIGKFFFLSTVGFVVKVALKESENILFDYKNVGWEKGKIVFHDIAITGKKSLTMQSLSLFFSWKKPWECTLHVDLVHPVFSFSLLDKNLIPHRKLPFLQCRISVQDGELRQMEEPLFFSFFQEDQEEHFVFFQKPNGFLTLDVLKDQKKKNIHWKCENFSPFLLIQLIHPCFSFEKKEGVFFGQGECKLLQDTILSFSLSLEGKNCSFSNHKFSGGSDRIVCQASYAQGDNEKPFTWLNTDFWKKIYSSIEIEKGYFSFSKGLRWDFHGSVFSFPSQSLSVDLSGTIEDNSKKIPFQIEGRGYFQSFFSNWLYGKVSIDKSHLFWQLKELSSQLVQETLSVQDLDVRYLQPFISLFSKKNVQIEQGTLQTSLQCSHSDAKGFFEYITDSRFFERFSTESISSLQGFLSFQGIFGKVDNLTFQEGKGKIEVQDGIIRPLSGVNVLVQGIETNIQLRGFLFDYLGTIHLKGDLKEAVASYFPKLGLVKDVNYPFTADLSFQKNHTRLSFVGHLLLDHRGDFSFGVDRDKGIISGYLTGDHCHIEKWPLENTLYSLVGNGSFSLRFQNEKVFLSIFGKDWTLSSPKAQISIRTLKHPIDVFWDSSQPYWEAVAPSFEGSLHLFSSSTDFAIAEGKFRLNHRYVEGEGILSRENFSCQGKFCYDLDASLKPTLGKIDIESFVGNVESIKKIFPQLPQDIQGKIEGKGTLSYHNSWHFDGEVECKDCSFSLNSYFRVAHFDTLFSVNSSDKKWECIGTKGILECLLGDKKGSYIFSAPQVGKEKSLWTFDFRVSQKTWDIVRFCGKALQKKENIHVQFDLDKTFFLGVKPKIHTCCFDTSFQWKDLDVDFTVLGESLTSQAKPLLQLLFPGLEVPTIRGTFSQRLFFSKEKKIQFSSVASDFFIGSTHHDSFVLEGNIGKNKMDISQIALDEYQTSFSLRKEKQRWKMAPFTLLKKKTPFVCLEGFFQDLRLELHILQSHFSLQEMKVFTDRRIKGFVEGQGCIFIDVAQSKMECDLDASLSSLFLGKREIKSEEPIHLHFSSEEGWMLKGFHVYFTYEDFLVHCRCEIAKYDAFAKRFFCKNLHVQSPFGAALKALENEKGKRQMPLEELSHFLQKLLSFQGDLDIVGDLSCSENLSDLEFVSQETTVLAMGKNRQLKNISFSYNDRGLLLDFWYAHENSLYKISNDVEWLLGLHGKISFLEEKGLQPLMVLWSWKKDDGLHVEKVRGSCLGLSCHFDAVSYSPTTSLVGKVEIDFSVAHPLLPVR
ncbi:MAG: hypothetical protein WCP39_03505, partial [Chlamydiota bacterium]